MTPTWRERSAKIIHERYTSIKAAQPNLSDVEILRMVSLHYYPFGLRENHPYAAWLLAMRDYKERLGIVSATNAKKKLPLFEG